jgi:hypothetical protein
MMVCTECNGTGETAYFVEVDRDENYVTIEKRKGICRTCNGSGTQPMTNADRIRAMSDDDLAEFIMLSPEMEFVVCECCEVFRGHGAYTPCGTENGWCTAELRCSAFKKWLQQPVEDE